MHKPTRLYYVYYHCTKKRAVRCHQRSVRAEALEEQVAGYLNRLSVPADILQWALAALAEIERDGIAEAQQLHETQNRTLNECLIRLDNLIRLKTAPANVDGALLSDEEYERQRLVLLTEKASLEAQLGDGHGQLQDAVEDTKEMLQFAHLARESFASGDDDTKRQIVTAIGSNLTLLDRKLCIQGHKPFQIIEHSLLGSESAPEGFEPEKGGPECTQSGPFEVGLRAGLGIRDDARIWYLEGWNDALGGIVRFLRENPRVIDLPTFRPSSGLPNSDCGRNRTARTAPGIQMRRAA